MSVQQLSPPSACGCPVCLAFAMEQALAWCFLLNLCKTLGGQGLVDSVFSGGNRERSIHLLHSWAVAGWLIPTLELCCLGFSCNQPFDLVKKPGFWGSTSLRSVSQLSFPFDLKMFDSEASVQLGCSTSCYSNSCISFLSHL